MSNYKISKTDSAPRNLQSVVFEILRTATIGFVMSVCLSVCMHIWLAGRPSVRPSARMEHLGSHWTVFHKL